MSVTFTPAWVLIYRDRKDPRAPDADAQIFQDEGDLIAQVADADSRCCSHKVLDCLHIAKDGTVTRIRDDLDRLCREYLDDWDAEVAHRRDLRWERL